MALRAIHGIDHIPVSASADWRQYGLTGLNWWSSARANNLVTKDANGFMQTPFRSGATALFQVTETGAEIPMEAKKIYLGFNMRVLTLGSVVASASCVLLDAVIDPTVTPSRDLMALLLLGELPGGVTQDKEYHVDLCFDIENLTVQRWVDDIKLEDRPIPAGTLRTSIAQHKFNVGLYTLNAASANTRLGFRDVFISDDVVNGNDNNIGRLGRQRIQRLAVDAVSGEGWTTTSATLKDGLVLPVDSTAPGVVSPAPPVTLNATLGAPVLVEGESITGITASVSLVNTAAGQIAAETGILQEGVTAAGPIATGINNVALAYGRRMGCFAKDPSGRNWNPARVSATSLTLKQA